MMASGRARPWLGLLLSVVLLAGCNQGTRLETLWDAPRFSLTDETGQPFSSDALANRAWLANFIYTNCPDECPLYLSPKMMALQREILGRNLAGKVMLLSFTVDPRRDTPAVLAEYGARYSADSRVWRFLTGPEATIQPLLQTGFKVGAGIPAESVPVAGGTPTAAQGSGEGHNLLHSNYFLLVDTHGKIRATYDGEQVKPEDMLRGLQQALREG